MTRRINKTSAKLNSELEELLLQAKNIQIVAKQNDRLGDHKKPGTWVVGQLLNAYPHLSRDYVTGIVEMLDRDSAQAQTNPEPWEVAQTIADAIRSAKRGSSARIRALDWAASVAVSLYPLPDNPTARSNLSVGNGERNKQWSSLKPIRSNK